MAVRMLLLNVARGEPQRVMRLLAAWAELGLIPRTYRYERPDPLISEGELLTADLLFQSLFLSESRRNDEFVTQSYSAIERTRKSAVRKSRWFDRSRKEDEQEVRLQKGLDVMVTLLEKSCPEVLTAADAPGCDLSARDPRPKPADTERHRKAATSESVTAVNQKRADSSSGAGVAPVQPQKSTQPEQELRQAGQLERPG